MVNLFITMQVDVIVDFVRFDTVRNEITIGEHTTCMYEDKKDGNNNEN